MKTIEIKGKRVPVPWRHARTMGAIVAEQNIEFKTDVRYGGHFICESVCKSYRPLIAKAPELFVALKNLVGDVSSGNLDAASLDAAAELIAELETP